MTDPPVDFDRIAAECLDAIASGRVTVKDCLEQYPAYSESLRPLLEIAAGLRHTQQTIQPSAAFTRHAGARLQARLAGSARPPVPARAPQPASYRLGWPPTSLPAIIAAAVLVVAIGVAALLMAANRALPGDPLYGLDRVLEQLALALANDETDIVLQLELAQERLDEAARLTDLGREYDAEAALDAYQTIIDNLEGNAPGEVLEDLEEQREQLQPDDPASGQDDEPPSDEPADAREDPEPEPTSDVPADEPEDPAPEPPPDDNPDSSSDLDAPGKSEDAEGDPHSSDAPGNWQDTPGQTGDTPTGPGNNNAGGNSDDADDTGKGNNSEKPNNGGGQSNNSDPSANEVAGVELTNDNSGNQDERTSVSDQNNPSDNSQNNLNNQNDNAANDNHNAGGQRSDNSGSSNSGGGNSGNKGSNHKENGA